LYLEQAEQVVEQAEVGLAQVPFELQQGPVLLEPVQGQVLKQVEQAEVGLVLVLQQVEQAEVGMQVGFEQV
jgi:hypothetical protein